MGRLMALVAALIGAVIIAWMTQRPPGPVPASASATEFSSARAQQTVEMMAATPHPIGSEANHKVRDALLAKMAALGLSPQVRPGAGFEARSFGGRSFVSGGDVENIVGVLPGRDRAGPALALMAHYDSVPASPGAGDDAAGVATALETVRAIKARGVPARDVMLVVTDGEEAGLLGASAFFARDTLAARAGFVINMESRGNSGRVQMFQTGLGNGATVALVRRTAIRPAASSLTGFIYEHMPNDTDFTVSRKKGIGGLNYAFIGHQFDYHSPTSTPASLDQGVLQDMGQQVLASAGAAAFDTALPAKTPDLVYNQAFGDLLVAYPPWMGWVLIVVAAGLIAWGLVRARRLETIPWTDVLRGLGAGLFAALAAAAVLHWARLATGAAMGYLEQRFLLAQAPRWEAAVMVTGLGVLLVAVAELARGRRLVAFLPLAAAVASCLIGGIDRVAIGVGVAAALVGAAAYGRPVTRAGAWAGVLVLGLILAIAAQAAAPSAAFIIAWPLLAAALGAAITAMAADRRDWGLALLALLAAVAVGWVGGFAHVSYLSLDLPELMVLPIVLAALVLWPLAQCSEGAPPERLAGPILLVIGVALTAAVRWNTPWDARHPEIAYVVYELDQDTGKAWRVHALGDRSDWSRSVLTADGGKVGPHEEWYFRGRTEAAPAKFFALPAPTITLDRQADGRLRLHAQPPAGARTLVLQLTPDTPGTIEAIDGAATDIALPPGKATRIAWSNATNGFDLTIRPAGPGKLAADYASVFESWPKDAASLPKRPPAMMGFDLSDSTFAVGTKRFSW
jgi:hypothetical protein